MRTFAGLATLAAVALSLAPRLALASPPVSGEEGPEDAPVEGPQRPVSNEEPPPPTLPPPSGGTYQGPGPGIDFAVPPPDDDDEDGEDGTSEPIDPALTATFPDPGAAPSDGRDMLVLGGVTMGLTVIGVTGGIWAGLENQADPSWLLPGIIVPGVGLLAFAAGGLYLGITRARKHRRWEIGYRVNGMPQGRGALVGGSFTLLAALGLVPGGLALLRAGDGLNGGITLGVGAAALVATPVLFTIGVRNQRRCERTGCWKRKPVAPLPPRPATSSMQLLPIVQPLRGGLTLGIAGRF
ncbi:MAG: hypothetical protein KDK70_38800 [Myxococcales bacterium]|nr:hypothetical protein [Myxococcales bacterium]